MKGSPATGMAALSRKENREGSSTSWWQKGTHGLGCGCALGGSQQHLDPGSRLVQNAPRTVRRHKAVPSPQHRQGHDTQCSTQPSGLAGHVHSLSLTVHSPPGKELLSPPGLCFLHTQFLTWWARGVSEGVPAALRSQLLAHGSRCPPGPQAPAPGFPRKSEDTYCVNHVLFVFINHVLF